ncbi:MAG: hypothetical protein K5979_04095 [Ruminococcus sp.]|nr:hypothetical protein [Ruminococcus sp.]
MSFSFDNEECKKLQKISIENDIVIDNTERIIASSSPEPPSQTFVIYVSAQNNSFNSVLLKVALGGIITDIVQYIIGLQLFGINDKNIVFSIVIGVICVAVSVISFVVGRGFDNSVRVNGENLCINGKNISAYEIDCIFCEGIKVKVLAGKKCLLKLTKADKGCAELIQWARAYDISIENTDAEPSFKEKLLVIIGITLGFGAVIFLVVLYLMNVMKGS